MNSVLFSTDISVVALALCGAALAFFAVFIALAIPPLRRTARHVDSEPPFEESLPRATIVIYAHNAADRLDAIVRDADAQDYPDFEILVVDDGSSDKTADTLERLRAEYPRLRSTFTPGDSLNLSRRKLALTLGTKGANGEIIVVTDADCVIPGSQWLRRMASGFADPAQELVLGFARPEAFTGAGRRFHSYDYTVTSARWIAEALVHRAFRGDSRNIAFRRDTFFSHKGFASNMWAHCGEDDLFVSEITTGYNTMVVTAEDAVVTAPPVSRKQWLAAKERHAFAAHYLHTHVFARSAFAGAMLWAATLAAVAGAILALPSIIPACGALTVIAAVLWVYSASVRSAQTRLRTGRLRLSIPIWAYRKPLADTARALMSGERRKRNFTWQR